MKIKKLYENITYNFIFSKKLRKVYLNVLFICISFVIALYIGYTARTNRIENLMKTVHLSNRSESDLRADILDLKTQLVEFNRMKTDAEYYRYMAFKSSGIMIPDYVESKDILLMNKMSTKYKIPAKYYYRLIYQESTYRHDVKSQVGASGYMQIMPATYLHLYEKYNKSTDTTKLKLNLLSAKEQNLVLGSYYLSTLFKQYKDWKMTFAAYNAGPGNVAVYNGIPPFTETQDYITFIMNK